MLDKKFLDEVEKYGITIRENCIGRAVYFLGLPLSRTVNKSDEYMEAYIEGFMRHMLMADVTRREIR